MAGFQLHFSEVVKFWNVLLNGLVSTFELAIISMVLGVVLGLFLGLARMAHFWPLRYLAAAIIEIFRTTPALVQLIWFFFVLPALTGLPQNVFLSSTIALSLYSGAFSAEIFRGGIQSIGTGQWEAARSIGMRPATMLRWIILPQAVKRMIPAFANRGIEAFKLTALAGTLGYADLLYQGQLISAATYRPIETYTIIAGIYVVILGLFAAGTRRIERRLSRNE